MCHLLYDSSDESATRGVSPTGAPPTSLSRKESVQSACRAPLKFALRAVVAYATKAWDTWTAIQSSNPSVSMLINSQRSLLSPLPQPEHEVEALARGNGLHLVREVARVDHGEAGALRDDELVATRKAQI